MEPGHEDREYLTTVADTAQISGPQWSPVMKTGNTEFHLSCFSLFSCASMEPGHEDREYYATRPCTGPRPRRLNGARS